MYFSENFYKYIQDAAVTLTSGNQQLIQYSIDNLTPAQKINIDFLHGAVGLATELGELLPLERNHKDVVNLGEEIADCAWYLAIFDRELLSKGFKFEFTKLQREMFFEEAKDQLLGLVIGDKNLLDVAKKNFIYGKDYEMTKIYNLVMSIHACLGVICNFYGIDIDEARNRNIAKLKVRYGDKFSTEAALNRDVMAERKVLEG